MSWQTCTEKNNVPGLGLKLKAGAGLQPAPHVYNSIFLSADDAKI
jgi:hypothetical protein